MTGRKTIPRGLAAGALCLMLMPFIERPVYASEPLTLARALDSAFARNPQLAAARQEVGIALGERMQAGVVPNPQLSWEVEDTRRETGTTTVMLSQALELGGKRGARVALATQGQDVARLELEQQANALRGEVMLAFHEAMRAQTGLALAEQSLVLAERGVYVASGRVRAGKSSPMEATRADVQRAETQLLVRRAQAQQASAERELARVTGLDGASVRGLQADTPIGPPPAPQALLDALEQSVTLRLAEARVQQREAALGAERAQRVPDLTVSVGSQYSREDRDRATVVGLSMPLPLFDRNQGNVLSAARRVDQARDLRNHEALILRTQTQTALEDWATAAQEITAFDRTILPAAQNAVETATRGFEQGKFGFLEVLDAQRTLIAARDQYLQSLALAAQARATLARLFGDTPPSSTPL